ncbi:hypothetical protein L798_04036 [Zootermopsis nevadensis]|uniref:Uncharacterized protein n=1 Tax=Zootermopsis nevadensis TaxID=136037 RepID=A0A067RKX0_ZOONE|nr:hypothetical protein L798_04036 [Zootermopsis nevadensis]
MRAPYSFGNTSRISLSGLPCLETGNEASQHRSNKRDIKQSRRNLMAACLTATRTPKMEKLLRIRDLAANEGKKTADRRSSIQTYGRPPSAVRGAA